LKEEGISVVVEKVFSSLEVEDPSLLYKPLTREKRPNRDLTIYILWHLAPFTHHEIGRIFGVDRYSPLSVKKASERGLEASFTIPSLVRNPVKA